MDRAGTAQLSQTCLERHLITRNVVHNDILSSLEALISDCIGEDKS